VALFRDAEARFPCLRSAADLPSSYRKITITKRLKIDYLVFICDLALGYRDFPMPVFPLTQKQ
jgi:hypothetical protein